MSQYVIIVAAGHGQRMAAALPKQFLLVHGKPILQHTIEKFYNYNREIEIVVVLNEAYIQYWKDYCDENGIKISINIVIGGEQRFHSVKNGIAAIADKQGVVAIHDAARPLVDNATIANCFQTASEKGNAIPVISPSDSLRVSHNGSTRMVNREDYYLVQTPQCFEINMLRKAYQQNYQQSFTDDASVVETIGEKINLVQGNRENFKITIASDLKIVEMLLR